MRSKIMLDETNEMGKQVVDYEKIITEGITNAIEEAKRKHKASNIPMAVCENGKLKIIAPEDIPIKTP